MPNSLELNVSPALLHTFANHPFHVRKDMEMNELVDSIRESGVIVPLIVRSRPEGGYEIISGHRRCEACRELQAEMELCEATPSLVQSRRLKEMSQSGTLTEHYLHTLLTEQKPNQRQKFFLNQSDVQRFFPPGYTPEQMQNTIFSLLKTWGHAHEHTQSQQELER